MPRKCENGASEAGDDGVRNYDGGMCDVIVLEAALPQVRAVRTPRNFGLANFLATRSPAGPGNSRPITCSATFDEMYRNFSDLMPKVVALMENIGCGMLNIRIG